MFTRAPPPPNFLPLPLPVGMLYVIQYSFAAGAFGQDYPKVHSEGNEISLYIITTCSNIRVMRMKEVITKDKRS